MDNITKQTNPCDSILGIFILHGYMSQSDMDNLTNKTNRSDSILGIFIFLGERYIMEQIVRQSLFYPFLVKKVFNFTLK
jgi:hypothetical protein